MLTMSKDIRSLRQYRSEPNRGRQVAKGENPMNSPGQLVEPGARYGMRAPAAGMSTRTSHAPGICGSSLVTPCPASRTMAVPRHLAMVLDGNRRWATARGLPAVEGHREGARRLFDAVK